MPTNRPRHLITETDLVADALNDAALYWPEDRDHRARLLVHLVQEGQRAINEDRAQTAKASKKAIAKTSGALTGVYGDDDLRELRRDWPE